MAHEGYVDFASGDEVRGWVYDDAVPNQPLTVEILSGETVIGTIVADQFRQDLLSHEKGDGRHAFHYKAASSSTTPLNARVPGKRWKLPRGGQPKESWKVIDILSHSLNFGKPEIQYAFTEAAPSPEDDKIVTRLIDAYHRANEDDPMRKSRKGDVWSILTEACHTEIVELLNRRDKRGAAKYLAVAHAKGLTFGITQGELTTNLLRERPDACAFEALRYTDNLVSLAEYLGVLDVEAPPEQSGPWAENLHADPEDLIRRIEQLIGIPVVPPQVIGSLLGIKTSKGILSGRDLLSLYAALRLKEIAIDLRLENLSICEIGGGLGGLAYYAIRLGLSKYTIIDLPLVNVLQGYFLMRALPGANICLYGETPRPGDAVRILPHWSFNEPDVRYELLVNQDSFPEMHEDYSLAYLKQARQNVTTAFFSINHESRAPHNPESRHSVVRDLVKKVGGFKRAYRFRHWLRTGYAEELYHLKD